MYASESVFVLIIKLHNYKNYFKNNLAHLLFLEAETKTKWKQKQNGKKCNIYWLENKSCSISYIELTFNTQMRECM